MLARQLYHVGLAQPGLLLEVHGRQLLGADAAAPDRHRDAFAGAHGRSLQAHTSELSKGPRLMSVVKLGFRV